VVADDLKRKAAPPTAILQRFGMAEVARKVGQYFYEKLDLGPAKKEVSAAFFASLEKDMDRHNYWRPGPS
jgi:hypothetical protein